MQKSHSSPDTRLRRIEWTVLRRLDGVLHGDYRTFFRGIGMDLAELREYQFEDDVRHIDWNVTARTNTPYVREYNEDRELTVWFLLDLSGSVDFGSGDRNKRETVSEVVALLARIFTRQGNRVGALLFDGGNVDVVEAGGGRLQALHLLHEIDAYTAPENQGPTRLHVLFEAGRRLIRRRSLIFVLSDFVSETSWSETLGALNQRHELLAVRVYDPAEEELPNVGLVYVQDAETGEQILVDAGDRRFRERFAEGVRRQVAATRSGLREAGVAGIELSSDDDVVEAIVRFSEARKRYARFVPSVEGGRI